jgi:hypothetical protein
MSEIRHNPQEKAPRGAGLVGSIILAQPGLPTCTRTQRGRTETGSHSANPPTQRRAAELVARCAGDPHEKPRSAGERAGLSGAMDLPKCE